MSGIGIITNPHSKLNKRNPDRPHLLGYIVGEAGQLEITRSLDHLEEVARRFLRSQIDILAINGGDGTISHTLSAFLRVWGDRPLPRIALLKGGTMNVLASHLGIKGNRPEHILFQLVEMVSAGVPLPVRPIQSLNIEGHTGFLYADGTSANILEEYYKNKTGTAGGIWLGIRLWLASLFGRPLARRLIRSRPIRFRPARQPALEVEALGCFASSVSNLPMGMPMFSHKRQGAGYFEGITVTTPPGKLLWRLPFILFARKKGYSFEKFSYSCKGLIIEGSEPFSYTLDGELYRSKGNLVDIKPGPLIDFIRL